VGRELLGSLLHCDRLAPLPSGRASAMAGYFRGDIHPFAAQFGPGFVRHRHRIASEHGGVNSFQRLT
jgi:hypothetical protein